MNSSRVGHTRMKQVEKIVIFGDSISTREYGNGGYQGMLEKAFPFMEVHNHSISGTGLTSNMPGNALEVLKMKQDWETDVSIVILWYGTNDWYFHAGLGVEGERDKTTIYGAMSLVIEKLKKHYPKAYILWPTPLIRIQNPFESEIHGDSWVLENEQGVTTRRISEIIVQQSETHGYVPLLMRQLTGIHEYNIDDFLEDKIHPNEAGYQRIGRVLTQAIKDLIG